MPIIQCLISLINGREPYKSTKNISSQGFRSNRRDFLFSALEGLDTLISLPMVAQASSIDSLYVNKSKDHYDAELSRDKGEEQLIERTQDSNLEEAYIFVKYKNGKSIWHETGNDEELGRCKFSMDLINDLMQKENEIEEMSFYHFHPDIKQNSHAYHSEVVSDTDLKSYLALMEIIKRNTDNLFNKTDYRVAVSSGIYTINSDEKGWKKYHDDDEAKIETAKKICSIKQILTKMLSIYTMGSGKKEDGLKNLEITGYYNYFQENRTNFPEQNKRWAEELSCTAYQIVFNTKRSKQNYIFNLFN